MLLEFMRFQQNEEALLTLASFMVRIRDKIPKEEFTIVPDGQGGWGWWLEWLTLHPPSFVQVRVVYFSCLIWGFPHTRRSM